MVNLFRKKQTQTNRYPGRILATQEGVAVPLAQMPDKMIAEGVLGKGIVIVPSSGKVVSPVDGTVAAVANSSHAFCIVTTDGLEVLIHIGVDTVELMGKGFVSYVQKGNHILAGETLCMVDLDFLAQSKTPCHTAIIVTNHVEMGEIVPVLGKVQAGISTVMNYSKKTLGGEVS